MVSFVRSLCLIIIISCLSGGHVWAGDSLTISAPPSIWVQQKGDRLAGPLISLLENLFNDLGIEVNSLSLPWARAISHLKSGKLDMIPVIFHTEEREKFLVFTESYAEAPTSIFVPHGKAFPFTSLADLIGKKGLIMRDDSISAEFQSFRSRLQLVKISGYDQMLKMLADNRADYGVAAQYGFLMQAAKLNREAAVDMLPVPIASRSLHCAFSKKSPFVQYLPLVNQRIIELKNNGAFERMVKNTISTAVEQHK